MRLREPAAWVAFGALVVNLVLALVGLATFEGPLVSLGWMWSDRVANPTYLLCLAVLVSFCVLRERTPHARQLTLISLVVAMIAVLLGLTLALLGIGATAPLLAVLAAIVPQALSIVAVGLLIKLTQLQAVPRRLPPGVGLVPLDPELRDGELGPVTDSLAPSAAGQQLQPTWHPDLAPGPSCGRSLAYGSRCGCGYRCDRLGKRAADRAVATPLHPHTNERAGARWPNAWRSGRPIDGADARRTIDRTNVRGTVCESSRGSRSRPGTVEFATAGARLVGQLAVLTHPRANILELLHSQRTK
jgi:hypothetical protein